MGRKVGQQLFGRPGNLCVVHALDRADSRQLFRIAADCVHTPESQDTNRSGNRDFLCLSDSLALVSQTLSIRSHAVLKQIRRLSRVTRFLVVERAAALGRDMREDFPDIEAK